MQKPLISIVVNFYNSRKYIPKLLKSVCTQTYTNWELICVDDCSPSEDSSLVAETTERLNIKEKTIIHRNNVNLGLSRAKACGIDIANGDYITFIDGDDWIDNRALEHLINPVICQNVDFVNMNYYSVHPLLGKSLHRVGIDKSDYGKVMNESELFDKCFVNFFGPNFFHYSYWAKLYNARILKNLSFEYPSKEDVISEDRWFNQEVFQHLNSGCFIDYAGYYWRYGGLSTMRKSSVWTHHNNLLNEYKHYDHNLELIKEYNYEKALIPLASVMFYEFKMAVLEFMEGGKNEQLVLDYIQKHISKRYYENFNLLYDNPSYKEDQNLIKAIVNTDSAEVFQCMKKIYAKCWKGRLKRHIEKLFL